MTQAVNESRGVPVRPSHSAAFGEFLVTALLAWGVLAFGAVYPWAYWPLAAAAAIVGLLSMSWRLPVGRGGSRLLSVALLLFLVATALQLVPLSSAWVDRISPLAGAVARQYDLAAQAWTSARHTLSIAPALTTIGLLLFAANAALMIGTARLLSVRGPQRLGRSVTVLVAVVALLGIAQKPLFGRKIYGWWTPLSGRSPFGPFVNRNHFAGWMLMAVALALGALCADIAKAMQGIKPTWRNRLLWLSSTDAARISLTAMAVGIGSVSIVLTLSKSGIAAWMLMLLVMGLFVVRQEAPGRRALTMVFLTVLFAAALAWVGVGLVAARFADADWHELNSRRGAWADAVDVASKFQLAGTGLNTYGVAMLFYQRHDLERYYSEAHNDYLQVAAEGGLLLTVPAVLCVAAFATAAWRRFREERSTSSYWIRAGAITGILAVGFQELAEFSLQMPGNAAMFSVLCGIALHSTPDRRPR